MKPIKYGEIVISSLQKALINQTPLNIQYMEALKTNNAYDLYINQIPNLFNECVYILSTRGKSLTRNKEIFKHDATSEDVMYYYFDLNIVFEDYKSLFDVIIDNVNNSNLFRVRDGDMLLINKRVFDRSSVFIRYKAYAPTVDTSTPMMLNLDLPREYLILLPIYIASELLKEERPDLSVQLRNQFEVELGELKEVQNTKNQTDIYGYL